MKKVAIIGAGPAGLTCAYELLRDNENFIVNIYEKEDMVGGLSKTFTFEGNKVDIGGHRFFSKDPYVLKLWKNIMNNSKKDFKIVQRKSQIIYHGRNFEYPIKMGGDLLKKIGVCNSISIVVSFLYSFFFSKEEKTLEDYYVKQFGKKLYKMFFKDYTKKVWGIDASELSADWGRQRVQGISLNKMVKSQCGKGKSTERTLISQFMYPTDGSGSFWDSMAKQIEELGGNIFLQSEVESINRSINQYEVTFKILDKQCKETFDYVVSSMPIKETISNYLGCPLAIKKIAMSLRYRNMVIIAIALDKKQIKENFLRYIEDSWIYVQESFISMGRIQILNNWSERMVHDDDDNLLIELEYFCDEYDEIWELSEQETLSLGIRELKALNFIGDDVAIKNWYTKKISNAYPIYTGAYNLLDQVRKWVNNMEGMYCIGRNGQHHYNNMDHSMQTGYNAAEHIKGNLLEKDCVWNVNMDEEYHESY